LLLCDGRHVSPSDYVREVGLAALARELEEHREAIEHKRGSAELFPSVSDVPAR